MSPRSRPKKWRSPARRFSPFALTLAALALATPAFAPPALADDASTAREIQKLREDLAAERAARAALEKRLANVERNPAAPTQDEIANQVETYLSEKTLFDAAPREATIPSAGSLIDVSVILDTHLGTSTAPNEAIPSIDLGDHDPHVRGFNCRNEEFVFSADVDPYFYGFMDVVYKINEEGESETELEEAYGVTTALPCRLQLKFGQFFTEFGRTNATHPHSWEFHNYPVALGRVFGGDGWRGQGARLSWIVPACFPLTVLVGAQNATGGTEASFIGAEGDFVGEHEIRHRDVANLSDLVYNARIEASRDFGGPCGGTITALAGISGAAGPNGTGPDGYTDLLGADLYLKWKPKTTDAGWPWVAWQTEAVGRWYHAEEQVQQRDDGFGGLVDVPVGARRYDDWGLYSQVVYGFARPWSVGARFDYAHSDGAFPGDHERASVALSYYPSEFSRIRLQSQYDHVDGLSDAFAHVSDDNWSIWLGIDLSLGKHGAHKF